MTDTKHTRETRPDTGEDWRALGFYHEPDIVNREWLLVGSRSGLRTLARMLESQADKTGQDSKPAALAIGPYDDFHIRVWERPGIDDESIHGPAEALRRLRDLILQRLSTARPNDEFRIWDEFARNTEYGLHFVVRDEDFDPATAMPVPVDPMEVAEAGASGTPTTPVLAFKFYDPDEFLTETTGLVRVERDALVIEFQTKNAILSGFDAFKPEVERVTVPIEVISSVKFKRGFFSAQIAVQARDMQSFADIPTHAQGSLRFRFKRELRDDAEQLANTLRTLIGDMT